MQLYTGVHTYVKQTQDIKDSMEGFEEDEKISRIPIITDVQIVEGIVASSIFVLFVYLFRYRWKLSYKYYLSFPWFFTWLFRKMIPNLYIHYKKIYGYPETYTLFW